MNALESHEIEFRWTESHPDLWGFLKSEEPFDFIVGSTHVEFQPNCPHTRADDVASLVLTSCVEVEEHLVGELLEFESRNVELLASDDLMDHMASSILQYLSPPESVQRLFDVAAEHFEQHAARLVGWITWRDQILPWSELGGKEGGDPGLRSTVSLEYRLPPNAEWKALPEPKGLESIAVADREVEGIPTTIDRLRSGSNGRNEYIAALQDEANEAPLAWSMFRNAIRVSEDRKLSTVLAVAAAEVAVKRFLVQASQNQLSEWLLINKQAPRWRDLVKQALPLVTSHRTLDEPSSVLPKSIWVPIDQCSELRNSYVHSGEMEISKDKYQELMQSVIDLLYALEWMRGEEWAFEFIGWRSRQSWIRQAP